MKQIMVYRTDIVEVNSGIVAVTFRGDPYELRTYNINATGVISVLDSFDHESDTVYDGTLVKVDNDTIALSFYQSVTHIGIIKTFDIDSNGDITLNQSFINGEKYAHEADLINLDNEIFVMISRTGDTWALLSVFNITNNGIITEIHNEIIETETTNNPSIVPISSDVVAVAYTHRVIDNDYINVLKTFSIEKIETLYITNGTSNLYMCIPVE